MLSQNQLQRPLDRQPQLSSSDSVTPKPHPLESNSLSLAITQLKLYPIRSQNCGLDERPRLGTD